MENKKPNYLKVRIKNIPQELKERNQWVLWKGVFKDNKWTKVPFMVSGKHASSTNPNTWDDFKTVSEAYSRNGNKFDGIGFVLSKDDPFTGWDFDDCRNLKTNETKPEFREGIKSLDSYSEISPSGTGYRVIVRATLPAGGRKNGAVECYQDSRYLTITGKVLDGLRKTIEGRQEETTALHRKYFPVKDEPTRKQLNQPLDDRELLDKAFDSTNGDRIQRLYGGEWSDYTSRSEADQALCNHLAFWLNREHGRIDRAFRGSGLYREKWDKKHYSDGRTYGQETINKAIDSCMEVYQGSHITLSPSMESFKNKPADKSEGGLIVMSTTMSFPSFVEEPVIGGGILPAEGHMVIAGDSGIGKSLLRTQLAVHISFGVNFLGFEIPTYRKVAVFQYENTLKMEYDRIRAMCLGMDIPVLDEGIAHVPRSMRFDLFRNKKDRTRLYDVIAKSKAGMIFYDPLSTLHTANENDNSQMRQVLEVLSDINAKLGTSCVVIHHFGKPSMERGKDFRSRGAVSIKDWAGTEMHFTRIGRDPDRELRKLEVVKIRDGIKPKPITLEMDDYRVLHVTDEESICPPKKVKEILESIGGEANTQSELIKAIEEEIGCARQTALNCLKNAVEFKTVNEEPSGKGRGLRYTT